TPRRARTRGSTGPGSGAGRAPTGVLVGTRPSGAVGPLRGGLAGPPGGADGTGQRDPGPGGDLGGVVARGLGTLVLDEGLPADRVQVAGDTDDTPGRRRDLAPFARAGRQRGGALEGPGGGQAGVGEGDDGPGVLAVRLLALGLDPGEGRRGREPPDLDPAV